MGLHFLAISKLELMLNVPVWSWERSYLTLLTFAQGSTYIGIRKTAAAQLRRTCKWSTHAATHSPEVL